MGKMIDFGEFKSTICEHGKAIVLCSKCFNPDTVEDLTDWKLKFRHPMVVWRLRRDFKRLLEENK